MEPQGRGATRTTKVWETEFKGIQHKETNCTVDFSKRMEDHWDRGIESRRRERVQDLCKHDEYRKRTRVSHMYYKVSGAGRSKWVLNYLRQGKVWFQRVALQRVVT